MSLAVVTLKKGEGHADNFLLGGEGLARAGDAEAEAVAV